ncbi:MAG: MFS transporter [Gemmatimonadaceae bacterium]|jgi:MFS family permease|nr:MFS transporter [Gemmatimonadaceae bacterium]
MARLPRNVWALAAVSFWTDVSSELIAPLLPTILTVGLAATPAMLGLIEGAAESTAALLKLWSGRWSDRVVRRKPLVVAGYTIASIVRPLVAVATSATQVLAIRMADRVGKGLRSAPRDALIADAVSPTERGRAFGVHRAADHAGAVVGPLVAWALLARGVGVRDVFLAAAVPGAIAVLIAWFAVREVPRAVSAPAAAVAHDAVTSSSPTRAHDAPSLRALRTPLVAITLFALGNSTDAFLLLRAGQLGVPVAQLPLLWALLHVVKSASSAPGGALSDRVGRVPLVVAGWLLYVVLYLGFAVAHAPWHAWALFAAYGVVFGLSEGTEKAMIADLAPATARGRAFGWYHLAIGIAALPASVLFGVVWTHWSAGAAFAIGSVLAFVAALVLLSASGARPTTMRR